MLVQMFSRAGPQSPRSPGITARELIDRGVERVRRDLRDQPAMQARLLEALGAIYVGLGLLDRAQTVLHEAINVRRAGGAADSQEGARAMWRLADTLRVRGEYAAAEPLAREALETTDRLVGRGNPQVGQMLNTLGLTLHALGRRDEAAPMFLEATEIFRSTLGPEHPMVGLSMMNTATSRGDRGDLTGAEQLARDGLVLRTATGRSAARPPTAASLLAGEPR